MEQQENYCPSCGKKVEGRAEKKFCDDGCKNLFHNALRSQENAVVGHIRGILIKNRRILKLLLADKDAKRVSGRMLREYGFVFYYYTHHHQTKDGKVYTICYDYGYMEVEADWYVVVKKEIPGEAIRKQTS